METEIAFPPEAANLAAAQILPRSQSERAYRELRRRILAGDLPPGEKLKIESLRREYDLSNTPLREALNRLAAEGLVVSEDNCGFRAAAISAADLRDITGLRRLLEAAALEESMEHGDDAWEARIVAAFHRLDWIEGRVAAGEVPRNEEWTDRHKAFHMALLSGCANPRLLALCDTLFDQSERYRRLSARVRVVPRNVAGEHRRLMNAVLERDTAAALQRLVEHIDKTAENVAGILAAPRTGARSIRRRAE